MLKTMHIIHSIILAAAMTVAGCREKDNQFITYADDLQLLQESTDVIEIISPNGEARIAVTPEFNGKVMTSSNSGVKGQTMGWINREKLKSDSIKKGGSYGGEDRLWIGPLGSHFSFYYQQIEPINEDNWLVPADFNDEAYKVTDRGRDFISMEKEIKIQNYIGTDFHLNAKREIQLLDQGHIERYLGIKTERLSVVAFESRNTLVNIGERKWIKDTGLPAVWSLGMFQGTDNGKCIIPLSRRVEESEIRQYLSHPGSDRINIKGDKVVYKTDGKYRNKLGIPSQLCKPVFGSYHPETNLLTIVQFRLPGDSLYFNSDVSMQENPFDGDPVQVYNNGPMDFRPVNENSFYEMESTSSMKEAAPGDSVWHYHRVYHLSGKKEALSRVAVEILGVNLNQLLTPEQ